MTLVDVGFVLSIILEFFRTERKQKFYMIQQLFKIVGHKKIDSDGTSRYIIDCFEEFKEVIEDVFPFLTDLVYTF